MPELYDVLGGSDLEILNIPVPKFEPEDEFPA